MEPIIVICFMILVLINKELKGTGTVFIYRLGPRRIKKMIQRKYGIEMDIEGKDLHTITKEAQEIEYN